MKVLQGDSDHTQMDIIAMFIFISLMKTDVLIHKSFMDNRVLKTLLLQLLLLNSMNYC